MRLNRFIALASALLLNSAIATADENERSLDLFDGMKSGELDVVMVAPSARNVYLRVTNNTRELLNIQLPKSFVGVPVLAQFQPPGGIFGNGPGLGLNGPGMGLQGMGIGLGNGMGTNGGNQSTQALGGGFQQGGFQQGGFQPGGFQQGGMNIGGNGFGLNQGIGGRGMGQPFGRGIFRVPAGRVGKVSASTVCLEFGKPEPSSMVKYRIVPIQDTGLDPRVAYACELLASKSISQPVAQAIAWHINDGLTWQQLADHDRVQSRYTGNVKSFKAEELQRAFDLIRTMDAQLREAQSTNASMASSSEMIPLPTRESPTNGRLTAGQ